jgi:molecular chaperone HtpG
VSGVVDSEDLPLNVSREMLQQNKIMNVIRKNLVKKCIELFNELAEDEDKTKYETFYDSFQQSLKMGIHEDTNNREKLVKLLRFQTLNHTDKISLHDYVAAMKEDQKEIFFITGESRRAVENSPFVKGIKTKGYDVVFMTDPIDEYMCQHVKEFEDKKFVNITKSNASFQEKNDDYEQHLCKKMKELLDVEKVVISTRLGDDPCCIVSGEYGWSANMERIMKAQTLQNNMNSQMMGGKKTLEINPNHKMIMKLQEGVKNTSMSEHIMKDVIQLMYDTALVSSGYSHEDPSSFSNRIYKMIGLGIDADVEEEEKEDELPLLPVETETEETDKDMEQLD